MSSLCKVDKISEHNAKNIIFKKFYKTTKSLHTFFKKIKSHALRRRYLSCELLFTYFAQIYQLFKTANIETIPKPLRSK